MKKIKKQDWTHVLQERLKDSRLPYPAFADLIGESPDSVQKSPANPGQPLEKTGGHPEKGGFFGTAAPWGWVLAGVAAALVAVLLIFRPSPSSDYAPVPDLRHSSDPGLRHSPTPTGESPAPAQAIGRAEPVVLLPQSGRPRLADGLSEEQQPEADLSLNPATKEDKHPENESLSTKQQAADENEEVVFYDPTPAIPVPSSSFIGTTSSFAGLTGEPPTHQRPRLALRIHASTLSGSGLASGSTSPGRLPDFLGTHDLYSVASPLDSDERPAPLPLSFGLGGEFSLSRHWALTLGLEYTQRAGYSLYTYSLRPYTLQPYTLHYLGVPLEAHYHFWPENRFRLYVGAGLKAEKCILAKGGEPLRDPFLFSANLQAGADYLILPGVRLYLAPVFSQYLNRSAYHNTWDSKPQLSLRAGLSFEL